MLYLGLETYIHVFISSTCSIITIVIMITIIMLYYYLERVMPLRNHNRENYVLILAGKRDSPFDCDCVLCFLAMPKMQKEKKCEQILRINSTCSSCSILQ